VAIETFDCFAVNASYPPDDTPRASCGWVIITPIACYALLEEGQGRKTPVRNSVFLSFRTPKHSIFVFVD
jgi:hypothetical protein